MNVESSHAIPFCEYLFQILGIGSLQCNAPQHIAHSKSLYFPYVFFNTVWRAASLRSAPHQQTPEPVYIVVDKLVHCDPNMYS
jgi:hypothetical protein